MGISISANSIEVIATVLADAESFVAGNPITVPVPAETVDINKIKVDTAATTVTFTLLK